MARKRVEPLPEGAELVLKGGHRTRDRRLDRVPQFHPKSREFPIRALVPEVLRSRTWQCSTWLDQGNEGACTGFSTTHEAASVPKAVKGLTEADAQAVYRRARQLDDWPGEDYSGSSVLGAVKAGCERGWYSEFRWAFSEEDLALAVANHGPAILGVNWFADMYDVDEKGFVHRSGELVGGHAILCRGISLTRQAYRLRNSWGKDWGVDGDCWVSREDMRALLADQGEACVPVVRAVPPVPEPEGGTT